MKCPRCDNAVLDEKEREGVVIDACPQCRGIWLDRGELEKIVARASSELDGYGRADDSDHHHDVPARDRHHGEHRRDPRRKKRWFETLGDLFD
jgi:Zn-finger nucleic acid-binding protein